MSRRRNQPNLPEETLRRARQAAGLLPAEEDATETPPETPEAAATAEEHEADSRAARRAARRRRRLERATQAHDPDEPLDAAAIAERLRAPTRTVSESELRADYAYVLRDLRSMAMLAAALVGALVLLALLTAA